VSAAYERVRAALKGTSLEGELDRLNAELHLTPDAPEWTLAALTFVGGAALRYRLDEAQAAIAEMLNDLPSAMKSSAVEIVRGLAAEISGETVKHVASSLAAARHQERIEDAKRFDALVREAEATQLVARNAVGRAASAAEAARTEITAHANHVTTLVRDLTERARIAAHVVVAAIVVGAAGAGTVGALVERHVDHDITYAHGWQDGAAAVRSHQHR
jgi:hypothetical protein